MFLQEPHNEAESGGGGNRTRVRFPQKRSIYAIQAGDDGPVKIGISANPAVRLSELQVSSPEKLRLLAAIPTEYDWLELRLHAYLRPLRLRGEWFLPHPALFQTILAFSGRDLGAKIRLLEDMHDGKRVDLLPPEPAMPYEPPAPLDPKLTRDQRIALLASNRHGTAGRYDLGCRCRPCSQAKYAYNLAHPRRSA